ncbi:secreted trypsin-like serine protease [Angulomicrobium tetraedrale]|uniref:Secreted trypsin-like serine protease n=1 Tax=Ancylobacter tetraedralis TaxID=217068 RepID=A0A839Z499_9HYPH|nr:trypsin-like serine protease [Ancylobacter tetraedralis]MBB3769803.1 secreted trypsin-like serine protease [Ancylobacter tetraedralis]
MRPVRSLALAALAFGLLSAPAFAIVGGRPADADLKAETAMIVSTRGASCTGVVLAPNVLLTAAHCVQPAADYAVVVFEPAGPRLIPASRIAVHPGFDPASFDTRRPTPDLALVKLSAALPGDFRPATLTGEIALPARRTAFTLAGFGVVKDGDGKSAGTLRMVDLPSIGTTGGIMVRLSADNSTGSAAAGGCTGDSGGPVLLDGAVAGIIGWSTAAGGARGCGGVTGATLVGPQRPWIDATLRAMGK